MIGTAIVLLLFATLALPEDIQSICASQRNYKLWPHENCHQFYACSDGDYTIHNCSAGLKFNVRKQMCDWAQNVNCNRISIYNKTVFNGRTPVNNKTWNLTQHNKLNLVHNNISVKSKAPVSKRAPVYNITPIFEKTPFKKNMIIIEDFKKQATLTCVNASSDGLLLGHINCNQYYKCLHGEPRERKCPLNLLYNVDLRICDWPENIKCGYRKTTKDILTDINNNNGNYTVNAIQTCASPSPGSLMLPHHNCDEFYQCVGDIAVSYKCPTGLLYNKKTHRCDFAEKVACGDRIYDTKFGRRLPMTQNQIVSLKNISVKEACAKKSSGGLLWPHENCDWYYECTGGMPMAIKCPLGLLFNQENNECDQPGNVNCGDRKPPNQNYFESTTTERQMRTYVLHRNETIGNTSISKNVCARPNSEGLLLPHQDCFAFYKCVAGVPVAMLCPSRLLYNPATHQCDYQEKVDCGDRKPPPLNKTGIKSLKGELKNIDPAQEICKRQGSDGLSLPHVNCDEFYKCDGVVPVSFKCAYGLLYNPEIQRCDFPENVDCGDRQTAGQKINTTTLLYKKIKSNFPTKTMFSSGDRKPEPLNGNESLKRELKIITAAKNVCNRQGSDGQSLLHENCDEFYKCDGTVPVAFKCAYGLLYNPEIQRCDFPENVDCSGRKIMSRKLNASSLPLKKIKSIFSTEKTIDLSYIKSPPLNETKNMDPQSEFKATAQEVCNRHASDGLMLPHENCDEFYKCDELVPVTFKCAYGLLFNPEIQQCDFPEDVECGNRTIISRAVKASTLPQELTERNFPAKKNIDGYYGKSLPLNELTTDSLKSELENVVLTQDLRCPNNLLYNPDTMECDFPKNIDSDKTEIIFRTINPSNLPPKNVRSKFSSKKNVNHDDAKPLSQKEAEIDSSKSELKGINSAQAICDRHGSDGMSLPHENCEEFYKCDGIVPIALKCPNGLFFNPEIQQCDFPENVDCDDRKIITRKMNESVLPQKQIKSKFSAEEACSAAGKDSLMLPHDNCDEFYECAGPVPVGLKCPFGLLYNSVTQQCDYEENVDCGERNLPSWSGVEASTKLPGDSKSYEHTRKACAQESSDGLLLPHINCSQYYECENGTPVAYHCPNGLLYNSIARICDWPENINCGNRIQSPGEKINAENRLQYSVSEVLEHPVNYSNGKPQINIQSVVPAIKYINSIKNEINESGFTLEAVVACAKDGSDEVLLPHEDCDKFYECSQGRPLIRNCPKGAGLLYNTEKKQCTFVGTVDCGDRTRPVGLPMLPVPSSEFGHNNNSAVADASDVMIENEGLESYHNYDTTALAACAEHGSEGQLLSHKNCEKFYECSHGKPVVLECSPGLFYSSEAQNCDSEENVECDDRILPATVKKNNADLTKSAGPAVADEVSDEDEAEIVNIGQKGKLNAQKICDDENSEGLLLPHDDNCEKYYKCVEGRPICLDCPTGLRFNKEAQKCDFTPNLMCKDRQNSADARKKKLRKRKNYTYKTENYALAASQQCKKTSSIGLLLPHLKCEFFYECMDYQPVTFECPSSKLFDAEKQVCLKADLVDCEKRIQPDDSENIFLNQQLKMV